MPPSSGRSAPATVAEHMDGPDGGRRSDENASVNHDIRLTAIRRVSSRLFRRLHHMTAPQRPSREEFIAFWKDFETFSWRDVLPYLLYPGCLALLVSVIRRIDPDGRFLLPLILGAIGYIFLVPYAWITSYHTRFARFIRCPSCGDWFGQDASGAYSGPNPKFRGVIETGRCSECGEQILSNLVIADEP